MKYLIYDIQHMPLWLSGTLVLLYVALFAYFVYIIVHYGRKHNCFLLPIVMVGLGLSACTSVTDTPVVGGTCSLQIDTISQRHLYHHFAHRQKPTQRRTGYVPLRKVPVKIPNHPASFD